MGNQQYDGNYAQNPQQPPAGQYPPPGYQQQPPMPPKKSALPIIVIAVVAVVVIAALGLLLLGGGGGGAAGTPEGAFRNYVSAVENQDIDGLIACDVASFLSAEDKNEIKEDSEMFEESEEDISIKVNSVKQVPKSELSDYDKEDIEDMIDDIEGGLDIIVEDWAVLEYNITVTWGGETNTQSGDDWVVLKIGGKWYNGVLVMGMSGGGTASTTPAGSMIQLQATSQTSATLTFGTFSQTIAPTDIRVFLTPSGGSMIQLSFTGSLTASETTMYATGLDAGGTAVYYDFNYVGNTINAGDYITVTGLQPGTSYTVSVFHIPSDSICSLAGQTTFQTPP